MKATNNLNSHIPESSIKPFNKMSNHNEFLPTGKSKRIYKDFYKRKMRMALKNPLFFEKII